MHVIQEPRMMRERGIRGASNHRNSIGLKTCFCLTMYGSLSTLYCISLLAYGVQIRKYSWLLWLDQCCATPAVPHCDATVRCSFPSRAPDNTRGVCSHIPTNWTVSWIEEWDCKEWEESLGTLSPHKGTLDSPPTGNKIMAGKSEHLELRVCNSRMVLTTVISTQYVSGQYGTWSRCSTQIYRCFCTGVEEGSCYKCEPYLLNNQHMLGIM